MGRNNGIGMLIFAVLILVFPLLPLNVYYLSIMIFIGINAIITTGLCMLMGYAGQISLGHAAFYGLGAYSSGILTTRLGLNPWPAMAIAIILTAAVAFVVGMPTLKLRGHYLAMATLGFGEIVYIALNELVDLTGGPSGFGDIPTIRLLGLSMDSDISFYFFVWTIAWFIFLFSLNIIHSRVGRALRSLHGSETAANAMGVNVSRFKLQIFILSAVYASLAGSLYAHFITFLSPGTFGLMFSILLVTMVVVGGMHNLWGAVLGAAILTFLPEYLRVFKDYDVLIYGAVLLLMVIFLPRGLAGGIPDWFRQRWR
jgi:branched-chain amino acid transport system permease protein